MLVMLIKILQNILLFFGSNMMIQYFQQGEKQFPGDFMKEKTPNIVMVNISDMI